MPASVAVSSSESTCRRQMNRPHPHDQRSPDEVFPSLPVAADTDRGAHLSSAPCSRYSLLWARPRTRG